MRHNAKFYESEYEKALIDLLTDGTGWQYTYGGNIHRSNREVLLMDDLSTYLKNQYKDLTDNDVEEIINHLRHVGGQSHFELLRNTYKLVRDGYRYVRHGDNKPFDISYVDFDKVANNIFRVVNQFEVGYGVQTDIRIPDVLLFVNGIPLCIFELKNPADERATIADAYEQIHTRYLRDIPHLLRYCPLSCISNATKNNTKLGTTYTPYEHYYAWKKIKNEDPVAEKGLDQVHTLREQGVNGQIEMAAAFTRAGFDAYDVHMSDLMAGRVHLADFKMLAACGGFSYGDVLGAGEGWAKSILFHPALRDQFAAFFADPNTLTLGVCNGCQMVSNLAEIIPGTAGWSKFKRNLSE